MSDPYAWIDSFAEVERADRAERRAVFAREEGRRDVLNEIEGDAREIFKRQLSYACTELAERIAEDKVRPMLLEQRVDYETAKRMQERELDAMSNMMSPMVYGIAEHAEVMLDAARMMAMTREVKARLSVQVVTPFRYAFQFGVGRF